MILKILFFNIGLTLLGSISSTAFATPLLSSSYSEGIDFGQSHVAQINAAAEKTSPFIVPGFQSSNPSQVGYAGTDMKLAGAEALKNNPGAMAVKESKQLRQKVGPLKKDDPLIVNAKAITNNAAVITRDASPFCVNGECDKHTPLPLPDAYKNIAALSGVAEASHDRTSKFIFCGNPETCHSDPLGFNNCCANSGWGQDLELAQCSKREQNLGLKKESGLCHEVGRYCSDDFLGFCTEHSKSYCCFPSKLSRVIQEQGRSQIGKGWGNAESPDCSGFSIEQLQKIDFGRIDFSDVYDDIKNKQHLPNDPEIRDRIAQEVQQSYPKDHL
jgi:hypothetical protein